jgi:hypothetical protein
MLAQNGNGPTDFENGDKDGWPEKQHGEDMNDDERRQTKKRTTLTTQWEK